jgi:hypothetical protein
MLIHVDEGNRKKLAQQIGSLHSDNPDIGSVRRRHSSRQGQKFRGKHDLAFSIVEAGNPHQAGRRKTGAGVNEITL